VAIGNPGGNLGTSVVTRGPIVDEFLRRAPATIELALLAAFIAMVVGIRSGSSPAWAMPHGGGALAGGSSGPSGQACRSSFSARSCSRSRRPGRSVLPSAAS
jgi:hypothetical protein